jgi:hypothetical protein
MNRILTFVGHIDETKRPRYIDREHTQEFPTKIFDVMFIRVDESKGPEGIVNAVNTESLKYIRQQGMTVRTVPPGNLDDLAKVDSDRMFVPIHMITHITAEVSGPIMGPQTMVDSTGLARMPEGQTEEKH